MDDQHAAICIGDYALRLNDKALAAVPAKRRQLVHEASKNIWIPPLGVNLDAFLLYNLCYFRKQKRIPLTSASIPSSSDR